MSENKNLIGKRVEVLDKGWIELQDIMGDDLAIVNAARVSFLGESKGTDRDKKLLFYLMRHRHTSPFEQVEFKFRVRAPVLVWWQWARHRMWHYNAQCLAGDTQIIFDRPIREDNFYVPHTWRKQSKDNKQGSEGVIDPNDAEALTTDLLTHYEQGFAMYQRALAAGVAKEQARLFLPGFSVYYTWVAKTDAHNLMHFLALRLANDAQEEIRVYAQAIYEHFFRPALPWTAEAFEEFILNKKDNP